MDDRERRQSELVAEDALTRFRDELARGVEGVFADYAKRGRLYSGATARASTQLMGERVEVFLSTLRVKLRAIAADQDAFAVLSASVEKCLDECATKMERVAKIASGPGSSTLTPGIVSACADLFAKMRAGIETKLEIARFDFDKPATAKVAARDPTPAAPVTPTPNPAPSRKGGRPPAEFWDDLWAHVAASLYDGTLIPKSQADIERAMADWIEANGNSAAESTVRARARRLWDRIAPDVG